MVGGERWILLGDDSKQRLPSGLFGWANLKGVTGPTAKPCRLSSRGTVASFQLHEGSKRVCVSFTCASFQRKCRSTGRENITYHSTLFPGGKNCGESSRAYLSCCVDAPGEHIPGSGWRGALWNALMVLQSSLLLSRTSNSFSQLQMKCRVNNYLLLKLWSGICLPPNSEMHKLWTQLLFLYHREWNPSAIEQSLAS